MSTVKIAVRFVDMAAIYVMFGTLGALSGYGLSQAEGGPDAAGKIFASFFPWLAVSVIIGAVLAIGFHLMGVPKRIGAMGDTFLVTLLASFTLFALMVLQETGALGDRVSVIGWTVILVTFVVSLISEIVLTVIRFRAVTQSQGTAPPAMGRGRLEGVSDDHQSTTWRDNQ